MNDIAMAHAVQEKCKSKFRGRDNLASKVVPNHPDNITREYIRITNTYMTQLNKAMAEHMPTIREAINAERENMRMDSDGTISAIISSVFESIKTDFNNRATAFRLENKIRNLGNQTRRYSINQWKNIVRSTLGINILEDYYMGEFFKSSLQNWTKNNVQLIKSIPEQTLSKVQTAVREGYLAGKSNTAIGEEIRKIYSMDRKHAQFIARDQTSKLSADITQAQQTDAGVDEYIWRTMKDSRVRCRHKELEGTRQKWSSPPIVDKRTGRKGHPKQDYQCRCVALPIFNLPGLSLPWDKSEDAA